MILILKLPVTPALSWAIWKLVAVEVMVRALPAQAPVPTCDPRTAILPAPVEEALQRLAVSVGRDVDVPLTHMIKAPKLGRFKMFWGISLIAIG